MPYKYVGMTTLYIAKHPIGVTVRTHLPLTERAVMGDISMLLIEGEEFCGLSFEQLEQIAVISGKVEVDDLPEPN